MTELGRLQRVDLRDIWQTEAQDFTPWLAREENLAILGDTIALDLELEAQEKSVGPFRADILCKDTATGSWVLIENQLERTDHTHMGQLLTYAAGLQAVTIVWVASTFTDEHRATLDWLNDITDDRFRFFGLEVELWRIGDSSPAPKFNIVSEPNDWSRSIGQAARRIENDALTDIQANYLKYWTAFANFLNERNSPVRSQKPPKDSWTIFAIGRSDFFLSASLSVRDQKAGVELYINDETKAFFNLLLLDRAEIEAEFGSELDWQELPHRKGSRILLSRENVDPMNEADWPNYHTWMADKLERLDKVFRQRVRNLDASEWATDLDA